MWLSAAWTTLKGVAGMANIVPGWIYAVLLATALPAACVEKTRFESLAKTVVSDKKLRDAEDAQTKVDTAKATARAIDKAMTATLQLQKVTDAALQKANQTAIANARALSASRAESDRLSGEIAARAANMSSNSKPSIVIYANALGELLDTCSREREEFAGKADDHAADALKLWDAWPVILPSVGIADRALKP